MKNNKENKRELVTKKIIGFFAAIADETRFKILLSLTNGPRTVNEVYLCIGREKMTLSAISHQLKQLRDNDIIFYEKKGREKLFQLSDDFCWCILKDTINHFNEKIRCKEYSSLSTGNKK